MKKSVVQWDGETYHVALQILLLLGLEAFHVVQDASAGVLDVLFRNGEGLFELVEK